MWKKIFDFRNWERTRLKMSIVSLTYFGITGWYAIYAGMATVALSCIASLGSILAVYIWSEGKRPSNLSK